MAERMVEANDVALCTESFWDPADPPVLLIMGIGGSMIWWEDGFCRMLAEGGRFVVRYDHRDTGMSTTYPVGRPKYTGTDLLADATRVLDGYDIAAAHIVGASAGGGFAQELALDRPERVLSVVLISTTFATTTGRSSEVRRRSSATSWRRPGWTGPAIARSSSTWSATSACSQAASGRSMSPRPANSCAGHRARPRLPGGPEPRLDPGRWRRLPAGLLDRGSHSRHPRHRRPDVPDRTRRGARGGAPSREAAAARGSGSRRLPCPLGGDRRSDPRAHLMRFGFRK